LEINFVSKLIEVTVSPQGQIRLETHGFEGANCREATKALEQALGLQESEQLKAEFHALLANRNTSLSHNDCSAAPCCWLTRSAASG
jgi:hypothetical protein